MTSPMATPETARIAELAREFWIDNPTATAKEYKAFLVANGWKA